MPERGRLARINKRSDVFRLNNDYVEFTLIAYSRLKRSLRASRPRSGIKTI